MSIVTKAIGAVESALGAAGSAVESAVQGAEKAIHAIEAAWAFLTGSYQILDAAWTWMVNGAEWLGGNVEKWAGETFGTLWHTITATIPDAIAWVFNQAAKWAYGVASRVYHELRSFATNILHFLERLIHTLVNAVRGLLLTFIRWATNPIRWVLQWGAWLVNLVTHPERLADWIAASIIEPVVRWLLKEGAKVIVWMLRQVQHEGSEFAHLIEEVLHDLL